MGIILWIIFGAFVGWIASMIMNNEEGFIWDVVVGILGSILGGFIMNLIGQNGVGGFNAYSFFVAILGACVLIFFVRVLRRER
jgi:uncharacterized membrane protein YeaQ/YmgE (transglycosylase-associated protein family)